MSYLGALFGFDRQPWYFSNSGECRPGKIGKGWGILIYLGLSFCYLLTPEVVFQVGDFIAFDCRYGIIFWLGPALLSEVQHYCFLGQPCFFLRLKQIKTFYCGGTVMPIHMF